MPDILDMDWRAVRVTELVRMIEKTRFAIESLEVIRGRLEAMEDKVRDLDSWLQAVVIQ